MDCCSCCEQHVLAALRQTPGVRAADVSYKRGDARIEYGNPSGTCCLGQVNQTVKRLAEECKASCEPAIVQAHDCCGQAA